MVNPESKLKGLYLLAPEHYGYIYPADVRAKIEEYVDIIAPLMDKGQAAEHSEVLREAQVIFSGWGSPFLDQTFLDSCPNLEVYFYGSGSVKKLASDTFWERSIILTNARAANASAVAEFTVSQILFGLKHGWRLLRKIRRDKGWSEAEKRATDLPGNAGTTVGLISLGAVARCVLEDLQQYEHKRLVYDPFAPPEEIQSLGAEPATLDEIFRKSDFVSLHTPSLPETRGMIRGGHFASMKPGATFLNTARAAVVNETEMVAVLQDRPDITAILDVTSSEPPDTDSPLYTMDNIVLTPHVAGVHMSECRRMGELMAEELHRYVDGKPLKWAVNKEALATMA